MLLTAQAPSSSALLTRVTIRAAAIRAGSRWFTIRDAIAAWFALAIMSAAIVEPINSKTTTNPPSSLVLTESPMLDLPIRPQSTSAQVLPERFVLEMSAGFPCGLIAIVSRGRT
jgi:hypothetical protein